MMTMLIALLAPGCGSSTHPVDGDADAGADGGGDEDGGRGEPPVEGQPGRDQPGGWVVDPAPEREIVEGPPPDASCCQCPASPLSMTGSAGTVALASSDWGADFDVTLFSASGERIGEAVTVPGHPTDDAFVDQMLVWTGDRYGAVFVDDRDGEREAYLREIGPDLTLGTESRLTTRETPVQLAVGTLETELIGVAFLERSNLFALRADPQAGTVGDTITALSSLGTAQGARAVGAGDRLGVAFSDEREGQPDIFFSLVDEAAVATSPEGRKVAGTDGLSQNPFVVWTGAEFAVVWEERREGDETASIWFARVDAAGAPIDGTARVVVPYEGEPGPGVGADGYHWPRALLWTGRELVLVAWRGEGRGSAVDRHDISVFRLDDEGGADPDGPLVLASAVWNGHAARGTQIRLPVAALIGPTELAVAWNQYDAAALGNCQGDRSAIHFARLVLRE